VLVAGYFSLIVAACALFGVMTIPDIVREGADFVQRLKSDSIWVVVVSFDKISVLFFSLQFLSFSSNDEKLQNLPLSLSLSLPLSSPAPLLKPTPKTTPPNSSRKCARESVTG